MPRANQPIPREPPAPHSTFGGCGATGIVAAVMGSLIAVGGIDHGFFEVLQGNQTTPGMLVHAIGPHEQMWLYGTEDAFTLIPNFLASGLLSIALSISLAIWSIGFIHSRRGSAVAVLLCTSLFVSGGGVAQAVFFPIFWMVSLQIGKPLRRHPRLLRTLKRLAFDELWWACLAAFSLLMLAALVIAVTGYVPGVRDALLVQHLCWALGGSALIILLAGILSALVHDSVNDQ